MSPVQVNADKPVLTEGRSKFTSNIRGAFWHLGILMDLGF